MFHSMFKTGAVKTAMLSVAVAVGMTGMMATGAAANEVAAWQRDVVTLVGKKQVYPRAAMSQEIEGRARVKVTIARSGDITGYEVIEGTGNALLDAEVVKLKDRINPLPKPPASLSDANLSFVLPLSWVLQ